MKKSLANQICRLWNNNLAGSYAPTKTVAEVRESITKGIFSVEIHPSGEENDGFAFHSIDEVVDIQRVFGVSAYIAQDEEHKLYARIY